MTSQDPSTLVINLLLYSVHCTVQCNFTCKIGLNTYFFMYYITTIIKDMRYTGTVPDSYRLINSDVYY